MAIDSRDKRSSAIHVGLPWRGMYPLPDGTIGQEDRQHAATFYRGVSSLSVILYEAVSLLAPTLAVWLYAPATAKALYAPTQAIEVKG